MWISTKLQLANDQDDEIEAPFVFNTAKVTSFRPDVSVEGQPKPDISIVTIGNNSYCVTIPFEKLFQLIVRHDQDNNLFFDTDKTPKGSQ